jgi:hypothetical protein
VDTGGRGGPKLWGDSRLNVYRGRNPNRGPLGVVVRSDPSVVRVVLVSSEGESELVSCGDGVIDGLRFWVIFVPCSTESIPSREIVGYDSVGVVVDRASC